MINKNKIKSGVTCLVPNCENSRRNSDLRFFRFPKNFEQAKEWLIACKIQPHLTLIDNLNKKLICSQHFDPMFIGKSRLLKEAIPSINLPTDCSPEFGVPARYKNIKTYQRMALNEMPSSSCSNYLSNLPSYPSTSSQANLSSDSLTCNSCIRSIKTVDQYRKLNTKLLKQTKKLKKRLKDKSHKIQLLTYKVFMLQRKTGNLLKDNKKSFIDILNECNIESTTKSFVEMLIAPGQKLVYTSLQKQVTQALYYKSPAAYFFMRNNLKFNLPSKSSIIRWRPIKNLRPGKNQILLNGLKATILKLDPRERFVTLIFDEVKIRQNLSYNEIHDEIQGYQDYGYKRTPSLAQTVCVFMVRGLFSQWKFVLKNLLLFN